SFVDAKDDGVFDMATGAPLKYEQVADGLRVQLARPVPKYGQARLRVVKTYKDAKSYHRDGNAIVFERSIPIRRAAFILPPGYRLTAVNVPSQVISEADGRIRVSFMQQGPGPAAFVLKGKPGAQMGDEAKPRALTNARGWEAAPAQGPTERARLTERAHQDRSISYLLL